MNPDSAYPLTYWILNPQSSILNLFHTTAPYQPLPSEQHAAVLLVKRSNALLDARRRPLQILQTTGGAAASRRGTGCVDGEGDAVLGTAVGVPVIPSR